MAKSRAARRPLWLIARYENGWMEVLTIYSGGERVLPVFSFEEEAEAFLQFGTQDASWRARETTPGELVSVLYGPCAGVGKVALDPLPVVDGEAMVELVSLSRRGFVQSLVNDHEPLAPRQSTLQAGELVENPGERDTDGDRREAWTGNGLPGTGSRVTPTRRKIR